MFGIGGFELFLILLFGFLIFGPDKLPAIARTIGQAIGKFKKARDEMDQVINGEILNPNVKPSNRPSNRGSGRNIEEIKSSANNNDSTTIEDNQESKPLVKESFAERKARYEKEKAQEIKRNEIEANRLKYREHGSNFEKKEDPKPVYSAEELYGIKPIHSQTQKIDEKKEVVQSVNSVEKEA